jgi:hypothetical protein
MSSTLADSQLFASSSRRDGGKLMKIAPAQKLFELFIENPRFLFASPSAL